MRAVFIWVVVQIRVPFGLSNYQGAVLIKSRNYIGFPKGDNDFERYPIWGVENSAARALCLSPDTIQIPEMEEPVREALFLAHKGYTWT